MTNMLRPGEGAQETLLHFAVSVNRIKAVKVLLSLGADPNIADGLTGATPLQTDAHHTDTAITRLLLDHGADLDMTSQRAPFSPAFLAAMYGQVQHLRLLVDRGAKLQGDFGTVLHGAMMMNADRVTEPEFTELVSYILSTEVDVHALSNSHNTALHLACDRGFSRGVSTLLSCAENIDVNFLNGSTKTPLMVALEARHVDEADRLAVVKELIHHNASVNIKDRFGMSPVDIAKQRNLGAQILFELGVHQETGVVGSGESGGTSE